MPLRNAIYKAIFSCLLFFLVQVTHAQNWEVDLLKDINTQHPSAAWKTVSGSAYPVSVGLPAALWLVSTINKDTTQQLKAYTIGGSVITAAIFTQALKVAVSRQRPYQKYAGIYPNKIEDGRSFPSAHTSLAFATATSLSLQYKKWYITLPAFVWAGSVGYSRMKLGEHYPTDVLAGAAVGAGSAWLSNWLTKKIFR
jgi:undecaprenyl-diphosphatase